VANARRGSLIGATWLIGIGLVFIIQRAAGWSWDQAWPLWLILVGAALVVSTIVNGRLEFDGIWALTWPIAWTAVGVVLLLSTTGTIGSGPAELIGTYWPWLLIALGVWFVIGAVLPSGRGQTESLTIPLRDASAADVRIQFGAGTLQTRVAAAGNLVDGDFAGGVLQREPGPGRIELRQDTRYGIPWLERSSTWSVGLTDRVPLDLRIQGGANRSMLDLRELKVRRLEVQTGASETRVVLPRAAGHTDVKTSHGAASLLIEVPTGVAARIRTRMAIGQTRVDETRFPRTADGYESPDFATATNRVDIDAEGGVGSLTVTGGA
jgi:hypothetical protein